ncbi:TetR family transcriptional regulator [Rhodococcus sp. G-MC3]|uniref:TetR/AcrR family transcriptional regulator n=1 Tax=Rhodococcus sp. G-MC3 TaxID=3046209 RepID=UPI0024BAC1E9|nr:TetR family transcriptional regulator [Rhodococcus sp. G-MC3]MDJ0393210.1 TetR family transcriptional regulator [Rhodococcus sp. G-MC3]
MTDIAAQRAKSGRRPGQSGTRERILAVARTRFAGSGFDKTSVRSVAADAGVDSALVHHYFGTKRELFVAAIELPIDPGIILQPVLAADTNVLGEALITAVMNVWESDQGEAVVAAFRSLIVEGDTTLIGSFLMEVVLREIAARVDEPPGSAPERFTLVATQMSGLLLTRYILKLEPIASMPQARVIASIGPTLQRYLTGPLPAMN